MNKLSILSAALVFVGGALAQAQNYGQCGGQGWSGATTCQAGWSCQYSNPYYSQCLPGAGSTTTAPPSGPSSSPSSTSTSSAASGTATLQAGLSWVRADSDPYFHQYLQSEVLGTASTAVLGSPATAAQFQITDGQLVQVIPSGNLYAIVAPLTNSTERMLEVTWSTTPAASGTFSFSGDTVEWSNPTISRPQNDAWYICPDATGALVTYINLGAYDYNTPAGCADETIHGYTGATAVP